MKLTHKAIARAAGYYAYLIPAWNDNYDGRWRWMNNTPCPHQHDYTHATFTTEEEAYLHCCVTCKLIEEE